MDSAAAAPLWPCILAALTPDEHELEFLHCSFESFTEETLSRYDLVGISVWTHTAVEAYRIGDMCREADTLCVMGGIHPFAFPEEAKQHCDAVVIGEGEGVWPTVLANAQSGKLDDYYKGELTPAKEIPTPDFSVVRKYKYRVENVIETTRGCPFNCNFCSATLFSGKKYRHRPFDRILAEIESWRRPSAPALLSDANVASDVKKAKELFRALAPYKLNWIGCVTINAAKDDELLKVLADSGCLYLDIGFESISDATLKAMKKTQNVKPDYKEMIQRIHAHGMGIIGNFIFGLDTDDTDVFKRTVDFVVDAGVDIPVFGNIVPFPGTAVYEQMEQDGRLLTKDWSRFTKSDVVFRPANMSQEELQRGFFWAFKESYSAKNTVKRAIVGWSGAKTHIYNHIIARRGRRQVHKLLRQRHQNLNDVKGFDLQPAMSH